MQCVGQFHGKPGVSGDDVVAAVHQWMEDLSDLGIIRTWHVTRAKPHSATTARGFILSIQADDVARVQAALATEAQLPSDIQPRRTALFDLLDTPHIELEPAVAARRTA